MIKVVYRMFTWLKKKNSGVSLIPLLIRLSMAAFYAFSSNSYAIDLLETWRSALNYDPVIAAARAALLAGQEKYPQGVAGLLPHASISGNAMRSMQDITYPPNDTGKQFNQVLGYQISASQVLYNASAYTQYQQSKKIALQSQIQFIAAQQNLILRVAYAYFDTLLATERIKQIQAQKKAVTQQIQQAKKSFEVGITTITDYNEAQAKYDEILAAEIDAEHAKQVKQNALIQLAQVDPDKLADIDSQFIPILPHPLQLERWLQQAQEKNPEIQAKTLAFRIAQDEVNKYRLLNSPTLHLEAGYTGGNTRIGLVNGSGELHKNNASIALILTVPLSTGGYRSAKLRESAALAEQERLQLDALTRQIQHKTRTAFLGVKSGVAQIMALRQALKSSQSLVDSTVLGHEVGIRTTEDILQAQQQYYSVKYKLIEAKIHYMLNRLDLAAHTGILQEQDLSTINQWLN